MLAKLARFTFGLLVAGALSPALAQSTAGTGTASTVPASAAAGAAVDVNTAIGGRIINCPAGLRISRQAVCLFATGTVDTFRSRIKTKLGDRVIEDWKTRTGSRNASLLFRTDKDITYVLLAQANANSVLAIVDAPASSASGPAAGSTAAGAPATTGVPYVASKDLSPVVSVQAADTVATFTRLGQSIVVTANNRSARFGTGALQLAGMPYTLGGQLYVPVTLLRSLNCTVGGPQGGKVTVNCGTKSAAVNAVTH